MGLNEELKKIEELAIVSEKAERYVYAQASEDGYDFTIYDFKYKDLDGGVIESDEDIFSALAEIVCEFFPDTETKDWNFANVPLLLSNVLEQQREDARLKGNIEQNEM